MRTVPTWNTARTPMAFVTTSWLLGILALAILFGALDGDPTVQRWLAGGAIALLALRRSVGLVGERGREDACRRFALPRMVGQLEELYDRLALR